jgi:hypothetical protein
LNVLDIDLDFFLDGRIDGRSDELNNRPDEFGLVPWSETDVTNFLENQLHLTESYVGAVVQSHDEVFYQWRALIDSGELIFPFRLVHVDAHSDLGMGFPSWTYLHSDFLSLKPADRSSAQRGDYGVNFGTFLAFALGCRWISEADFIINRNWHDDILRSLLSQQSYEFVEERSPTGVLPYGKYDLEIELMQTPKWEYTSCWDPIEKRKPIGEPRIPFNILPVETLDDRYSKIKWDYVFLSHSPGYVPSYADHLLRHIGRYIRARNEER